jgi:hypothetical protein
MRSWVVAFHLKVSTTLAFYLTHNLIRTFVFINIVDSIRLVSTVRTRSEHPSIHPPTHPSIHSPIHPSTEQPGTLARGRRNPSPSYVPPRQHDITGALTHVVPNAVWNQVPGNITNPARVLRGDPPQFRPHPTWDAPVAHSNSSSAAEIAIYKEELQRHKDSSLTTALLDSVGEVNRIHLKTTFPQLKPYMVTPRQMIDAMCAKHDVATGDDVAKLRASLSLALTSLSDLTTHMENFPLASQRLTRSGQRPRGNQLHYFELFLETVSFPLSCA